MGRPSNKQLEAEAQAKENQRRADLNAVEDKRRNEIIAAYEPPKLLSEASYDTIPVRAKFGTFGNPPGRLPGFAGLRNLYSPFSTSLEGWDVSEAIRLCEAAYWNFPLLKNTIDVMAELANSAIYIKGGNKVTRTLVEAWMEQINLNDFRQAFFREWFRSGTIPIYRTDGEYDDKDITKITQVFGAKDSKLTIKSKIVPIRYTILNPIYIRVENTNWFVAPTYMKVLSPQEVLRILNPVSEADKNYRKTFSAKQLMDMKNGINPLIPLDPEFLTMVLYKKQPYEPLAVPMAFPLLQDINDKLEMKRKDAEFVKKMDNALLLVNVGAPLDAFNTVSTSKATQQHIQQFFATQSVARVMVVDHTVKAEWKIPDVNSVLGAAKYEQIDQDLAVGLNAILFNSDEKFSNTSIKVQVFIERLKEARNAFLDFFQAEVKRLCENVNAQTYPEIFFEEISLKDELQYTRIYTQLAQLGLLTPKELFDAMETGKIPTAEESVENQQEYYNQKKEGYYFPLVGGNNVIGMPDGTQYIAPTPTPVTPATTKSGKTSPGRPSGTSGTPKSTANIENPGSEKQFSSTKLLYYTNKANKLSDNICKELRAANGIKKLTRSQKDIAEALATAIIANEEELAWKDKIKEYISAPQEINPAALPEIKSLATEHNLSLYNANILRLSIV